MNYMARLYVKCSCGNYFSRDISVSAMLHFLIKGVKCNCAKCENSFYVSVDDNNYELFLRMPKAYILDFIRRNIHAPESTEKTDD